MPVRTGSFTSESVSEGHPDKLADRISDAILDAVLRRDPLARGWARRALVQIAYAIGVAAPVSLRADAAGADARRNAEIAAAPRAEFDLTPAAIIRHLDLRRPIWFPTAHGAFGRPDLDLPWEATTPAPGRP